MSDAVLVPPRRKALFAALGRSVSAPALAMAVAGLLALPAPALAANMYWNGGVGNWSDAAGWDLGASPGTGDNAYVNEGTVTLNDTVTVTRFWLQQRGTIVIGAGGSLTTTTTGAHGVIGRLALDGGTLNTGSGVTLGSTGAAGTSPATLPSILSGNGTLNFNANVTTASRFLLTVNASGIVSPGADGAIGTLTVHGNVTFAANSTYLVHVGNDGQSDLLQVLASPTTTAATGRVTLNSGRLVIAPLEGINFQNGWRYTILTAEGGISGSFNANRPVIGDFARFDVALANGNTELIATITGVGATAPLNNIVADLSPGGQGTIDTHTIVANDGHTVFKAGSVYHVDVGENGQSDKVVVVGTTNTATIEDGAKLVVSPLSGIVYTPGWQYTILEAAGIEGRFDDPTANGDFASLSLIYGPRSVILRLDSVPRVDFAAMAQTDNQRQVAGALNTVPQGTTLYNTMFLVEAGGTPDALDQLSGVVHASTKGALILHNLRARDAIGARLGTAFGLVETSGSPVMSYAPLLEDIFSDFSGSAGWEPTNAPVAWASAYGGWGELQGEIATYDTTNHGVLFGIDSDFWGGLRLGGVLGYGAVSLDGATETASAQSYLLGLYGGGQWNGFSLQTGILYGFQNIETQRSVSIAGITGATFTDALSADYMGDTLQVFGEMSYSFDAGMAAIEPFVGFSTIVARNSPFTETGGAAALSVSDEFIDATFAMFGLRASTELDLGGITARVNGSVGWRQGLGSDPNIVASFAGSEAFTVADTAVSGGVVLAGAGVDLQLNANAVAGVSWNGQFGSRVSENSVLAKVGFTF